MHEMPEQASLRLHVLSVLHLPLRCVSVEPALTPSCALCSLMRARLTCLRSEQQSLAVYQSRSGSGRRV